MSKLVGTAILLVFVVVLILCNLKKEKKSTILLGQEMAAAAEKEQQRIKTGNYSTSPLPDFNYSKWPDEQSLINPIENELDRELSRVCKGFENSNKEKRKDIQNSINQDQIYTLLAFAQRATLFGVRKNERSYIHDGFTAIAMIEAERCDYRDALVALGFLNYGVQILKLDSRTVFAEAMRIAEGKTKELIHDFAERPIKQKSIETIGGYTAIETANGIGFIQTNYEKYNPKRNLVNILFGLSDVVFKDKYRRGEITIGESIAPTWLGDEDDKRIETLLSKATGCASLSTSPRKEYRPEKEMQMLLIYLAEFKDSLDLQMLVKETSGSIPKNFARLSFAEENIFCVVIQRAAVDGVGDFETSTSLRRLESLMRGKIRQN